MNQFLDDILNYREIKQADITTSMS